MSHISFSFKPTFNTLLICLQLRVSAELYTIRTVGHRLRDSRQADLTDHTPEQISWSGPTRWPKGRLVSTVAPTRWPKGRLVSTVAPTRWPKGRLVSTVAPTRWPKGRLVSTVAPTRWPKGRLVSTVAPTRWPKGRLVSTVAPTRWPKGRLVSTVAPSYCAPRYYADTDIRRGRGSRFFAARGKYQTGLLKHT